MAPTNTHREQYAIVEDEFAAVYEGLKQLIETELPALERRIEATGAPVPTTHRLPTWQR